MPSTLVHLALGALIAAGLLGEEFDARALGLVLAATALPDLDTFVGIALPGTHRALLHTAVVPVLAVGIVYYDTRVRDRPVLGTPRAVRLAWVAIAAYALAGIGPDLFTNGANLFYPIHDRFVSLSGRIFISDQRGLVQTIWQQRQSIGGTTQTVHYSTGVDPTPGPTEPVDVERIFPLADSGFQLLIVLVSAVVSAGRLWTARNA
jgi:hypothetical protein